VSSLLYSEPIAVAYGCFFYGTYFYVTWFPTYLLEYRHLSLQRLRTRVVLHLAHRVNAFRQCARSRGEGFRGLRFPWFRTMEGDSLEISVDMLIFAY